MRTTAVIYPVPVKNAVLRFSRAYMDGLEKPKNTFYYQLRNIKQFHDSQKNKLAEPIDDVAYRPVKIVPFINSLLT